MVLDEFRFKGDALFTTVRNDLKTNKRSYHKILRAVGKKGIVLHLTKDQGQLDFLLSLDSVDRKIITVMPDATDRSIFANSFITNNGSKITVFESISDVMEGPIETLIIDSSTFDLDPLLSKIQNEINLIVLFKSARHLPLDKLPLDNFETQYENDTFAILQKNSVK